MDPSIVFSALIAAIAALWAYMVKERNDRLAEKDTRIREKDERIDELVKEISSLRQRTDSFDAILTRNTDALGQSAESLTMLVNAIQAGKIAITASANETRS